MPNSPALTPNDEQPTKNNNMKKRPIDSRFNDKALAGIKFTTIRDKPWKVGDEIMLYNWMGAPYRSKQKNLMSVKVISASPILIYRPEEDDKPLKYQYNGPLGCELWQSEGFESREEMDQWFRPLIKPGKAIEHSLMQFTKLEQEQPDGDSN